MRTPAPVQRRRLDIHDEIGFPDVLHARLVALLSDVKKPIGSRVAVRKKIGAVKDEILVVKHVHHQRRVRDRQEFDRLSAAVDQAMPSVERRSEQTPGSPFEYLLAAAFLPHFRGSLSTQNANHFFIKMFLRLERATGRDFSDVHAGHPFHPVQIDKSRFTSDPGPRFHLHFPHILHAIAVNDGYPLTLHPLEVSRLSKRGHQISHLLFSRHRNSPPVFIEEWSQRIFARAA
ncbi:MAG: hypothetical protein E6J89_05830 [Deltaproteobacteria bacterium]|nr:MAG: hypothetical protein E6J89_05830 [Deltaproteobacteria bacterium]